MVVLLGSRVVTQGGGTKVEIGFTKVRSISSGILTISMLINSVGLGGGGFVAEDGVASLSNVKVRFTLLLLHDSVGLGCISGDSGLSGASSIHSV